MNRQTIQDLETRCKAALETGVGEWGLFAVVFLIGIASFGLGRLSALEAARPPVSITEAPELAAPQGMYLGGEFVAAKGGSAYYYPWCSGADRIAKQNQVWFSSEAAAQKAGYAPAKNCKGLGDSAPAVQ